MNDFVKELNFDSDTFENIKRDMNFVLQRLLGNMQEKGSTDGTMTVKIDVSLVREWVPNYNPEIEAETRMVSKPKFKHKVTSQVQIKDEKSGNLDTEMELFMNEETGEYEMRPVADTTQRSFFDADFREAGDGTTEVIEAETGQRYIEHPALPGDVADEGALPGAWKSTKKTTYAAILRTLRTKTHKIPMTRIRTAQETVTGLRSALAA